MSIDFKAYIAGLVQNFANNGIAAEEKDLQYGRQLVLTSGSDKTTLSVYNGKKGIKLVWSGKNAAFTDKCKSILMQEDAAGADYRLLKDFPDFQGIWAGSDESGKGDFIGPLVVAAVICDEKSAAQLFNLGVKDCKIVSDKDVLKLRTEIEKTALATSVLALSPKIYNYRYSQIKAAGQNLNHLLSSGHAAALCAALAKCPQCNYALVDRFAANNNMISPLRLRPYWRAQNFCALWLNLKHRLVCRCQRVEGLPLRTAPVCWRKNLAKMRWAIL